MDALPYSQEAEEAVLNCMCHLPACIASFGQELPAEAFHNPNHRILYLTMLAMVKEDKALDLTTITARLAQNKRLEAMGGPGGLMGIIGRVDVSTTIFAQYRGIMHQAFLKREGIKILDQVRAEIDGEDAIAWLAGASSRLMELYQRNEIGRHKGMSEHVTEALDRYSAAMEGNGRLRGSRTGFDILDHYTGGLQEGHLWAIGGSYSDGKSSYCGQMILNAARFGTKCALYGLEMPNEESIDRLFGQETQIDSTSFSRGTFTREDFSKLTRGAEVLNKLPIELRDVAGIRLSPLIADMRFLNRSKGIKVFAVDYGQLISPDSRGHSREREIAVITAELKTAAKVMRACILLPMQLNQDGKLRESTAPTGDSDKVIKIRVPRVDPEDQNSDFDDSKRVVMIEKNRGGPRYRKIGYDFCGSTFTFLNERDVSKEEEEEAKHEKEKEKPVPTNGRNYHPD